MPPLFFNNFLLDKIESLLSKSIIKIGEEDYEFGFWLEVEKYLRLNNLHLLIDLPCK